MTELLDAAHYIDFLARTHPTLDIEREAMAIPSFTGPLDVREPLLPGGAMRTLADLGARVTPDALLHPAALFLGTPFERYDQSALLDAVEDPAALLEKAAGHAKAKRCELVVVTNLDPHHPRLAEWTKAGAKALPSFPDTLVDVRGDTFEEHLATLRGEDRSGIRRNVRKFERAGHTLERLAQSAHEANALYDCYRPYFDDATVQWFPHTKAYFAGLAELDSRVHLTVARHSNGDLIGFIINFVDGSGMQSGRIGVRPDHHRKDAIYFRLLYAAIEETIKTGGGMLSLEPTGYRMKRHLGARAKPLVNLCFGVSATWRMLLGGFSGVGAMALSHLDDTPTLEKKY